MRAGRRACREAAERRYLVGPQSVGFELVHAVRIFAEYLGGLRALHTVDPCVTVFGSARLGAGDPAYELGRRTGALLAEAGFTVMTGGGPGVMEAANRGAREAGGRSIGCNIVLPVEQHANPYVDQLVSFHHFFIRKVMLVKYSYGFIVLPGGFGTFDEVFEAATLVQTGKISDFPIVLLGRDFWDPVLGLLRTQLVGRGTVDDVDVDRFLLADTPEAAVELVRRSAVHFGLELDGPTRRVRRRAAP